LNSVLASASAAACLTLLKARSTSVSPAVNAMPLARKPMTGITTMATMRPRTETFELSDLNESVRNIEGGMAQIVLAVSFSTPDRFARKQSRPEVSRLKKYRIS
jgi:hypothetical protein